MSDKTNKIEENEEVVQEIVVENEITDENKIPDDKKDKEKTQELNQDEIIAQLQEQLKQSEDKYFRVHADFENIKKRLEKEKYSAIDYASEKFAKDLLAPIDSLEMALVSEEQAKDLDSAELLNKLKEGVELTIKNFNTSFEKHDISIIETDGEFDPNFHNAIMQIDSPDHEDGHIVAQLQKGYKFKERLLRPAMVSICKKV